MKRTQSNHIKFLISEFESRNEDTREYFQDYVKEVNPKIKVNEKIKPYHVQQIKV